MLNLLRTHDANLVELPCGRGSVLVAPLLAGRIFCQFDGELIHRLDGRALQHPSPTEYNNLGGNSLWPAPEGGLFAFNYLPGSDQWLVQDGISKAVPTVSPEGQNTVIVEKAIQLSNRKGISLHLTYRRKVYVPSEPAISVGYTLEGMRYQTVDTFEPLGEYLATDVLLAPWSLEQFPGADGIVAFGRVQDPENALNCDFYGDPGGRISWREGCFAFRLGGADRHQIGVRVQSRPQLIGSLDTRRSLLVLRKTPPRQGLYFNIADNEQVNGPFSSADLYSIFNGGELGFYELETIGAMQEIGGNLAAADLESETVILHGSTAELQRYLCREEGIDLAPLMECFSA